MLFVVYDRGFEDVEGEEVGDLFSSGILKELAQVLMMSRMRNILQRHMTRSLALQVHLSYEGASVLPRP